MDAARRTDGLQADALQEWCRLNLGWVYGELLRGIVRRTQCAHRAQDVLHDALVRFALSPGRETARQPHAYLRTVVGSVLADHGRDAMRELPLLDEHTQDAVAPSAEVLADLRQRLGTVQRIVDNLPPRCREVFWLFRIEGLRQPEIARRLDISVNMVERHVMRALLDLRTARDLLP